MRTKKKLIQIIRYKIIMDGIRGRVDFIKERVKGYYFISVYLTVFCMSFVSGEGGGGGAARRCARDASSPAQAHAPPAPSAAHTAHTTHTVKSERLSPHDSNASR